MQSRAMRRFLANGFLALVWLFAACGGPSKAGPTATPVAARTIHTQDTYFYSAFRVADAQGKLTDITDAVLARAKSSLGPPIDIGKGFSLREALSMKGSALSKGGTPYRSIAVNFAVIRKDDASVPDVLIGVSSADLAQEFVNIGPGDLIEIDMSGIPGAIAGARAEMDSSFVQTLMLADRSTEVGLSNLAIFARRWITGSYQQLVIQAGDVLVPGFIIGQPATILAGDQGRSSSATGSPDLAQLIRYKTSQGPTEQVRQQTQPAAKGNGLRYTGKAFSTVGEVLEGGFKGCGAGACGGAVVGGVLASPTAEVIAPATVPLCAIGGFIVGGWVGVAQGLCKGIGAAIKDNNPQVTSTLPTPTPTLTPTPLALTPVAPPRAAPTPVTPTPRPAAVNRPPVVTDLGAYLNPPVTTYYVTANDPDGGPLTYEWKMTGEVCGTPTVSWIQFGAVVTWSHSAGAPDNCSHFTTDHAVTESVTITTNRGVFVQCVMGGSDTIDIPNPICK